MTVITAAEPEIIALGGFTIHAAEPWTRLRGTAWDPRDRAAVSDLEAPSGRAADYPQPYPDVRVSYTTPRQRAEAAEKTVYDDSTGKLAIRGTDKIMTRECAACGKAFEQVRPVSQTRRWGKFCSDVCRATHRRGQRKRR